MYFFKNDELVRNYLRINRNSFKLSKRLCSKSLLDLCFPQFSILKFYIFITTRFYSDVL